jgi:putative glutamine amidotransferase
MVPVIGLTCSTLIVPDMRTVPRFAVVHHYVDCVRAAGGLPVAIPSVEPETADAFLGTVDGLVLTGGLDVDPLHYGQEPDPDLGKVDTQRDEFELALVRAAHARRVPVLGVCRGLQVMNVALGGTLHQHIPTAIERPVRHEQEAVQPDAMSHGIDIEPGTRLHRAAGTTKTRVNTFHHQAADRVADGLVVTARAPDGVIEGLEDPGHPWCVAVQWHPERRPDDPLSRALFSGLVAAARAARAQRVVHPGPAGRR